MEQLIAKYNKKIIIALATVVGLFIIFTAAKVIPTFQELAIIKTENENLKRSITLSEFYTNQVKKIWGNKGQACLPSTIKMVDSLVLQYGQGKITTNAILAVMTVESGFNNRIKSSTGANGIMQIILGTAKSHEKTVTVKDLLNPVINTRIGIKELVFLKDKFEGNMDLVLLAYNLGPNKIKDNDEADNGYSWKVFKHSYEFAEMEKRF